MSLVNIVLVSLAAFLASVVVALAFYACAVRPYLKMSDDINVCNNHIDMFIARAIQIPATARRVQTVLQVLFTIVAFALALGN